jgi:thiamine transporter ThiT
LLYTPFMPDRSDFSFFESLTGDHRRRFYEQHRSLALLMILILLVAPFAGLYVTGLVGSVLGVLLSVIAYYLTPPLWIMLDLQ